MCVYVFVYIYIYIITPQPTSTVPFFLVRVAIIICTVKCPSLLHSNENYCDDDDKCYKQYISTSCSFVSVFQHHMQ